MSEYSIPHDDNKTYRKKVFLSMFKPSEPAYIDGATDYCLLPPFADDYDLTTEQRLWLAYLYGLSYSCTTAIRFFIEFNWPSAVKPSALKAFWKSQKATLWFNPDKKYLKNNDQVFTAIKSLLQVSKGNLTRYFVPFLEQGFDSAYKEILKNWKFFGPHGAYLFFDALYGLCPELYSDPEHIDWKHCGKTVTEGMAHLLYQDECLETKKYNYDKYNKVVDMLVRKTNQPKVIIESVLCAFRKLFKGSRYYGYYADRMLEECHSVDSILEDLGIDIWYYRQLTIPEELRGENNNWEGIRKSLCKSFLKTGELK